MVVRLVGTKCRNETPLLGNLTSRGAERRRTEEQLPGTGTRRTSFQRDAGIHEGGYYLGGSGGALPAAPRFTNRLPWKPTDEKLLQRRLQKLYVPDSSKAHPAARPRIRFGERTALICRRM